MPVVGVALRDVVLPNKRREAVNTRPARPRRYDAIFYESSFPRIYLIIPHGDTSFHVRNDALGY